MTKLNERIIEKHKPLTKFEQGYICALSNIIGSHGLNTEVYEAFIALGTTLDRVLAWKALCEYDRYNLNQLKEWGIK